MSRSPERTVRIAELKAHLSEHLRTIRAGRTVTVLDRRTPVARLVPVRDEPTLLAVRPSTGRPQTVRVPSRAKRRTDSLAVLLGDRRKR